MLSKVLLFEGAPGAGKSTLSEFVAEQLHLNGLRAEWLEEHVLAGTHFADFSRELEINPHKAVDLLLRDWDRLIAQWRLTEGVFLLDGAYFGNTLKFLLAHGIAPDQLQQVAAEVDTRLMQVDPLVVNLCGETGRIFGRAIDQRSRNWAQYIARDVEEYPFQRVRARTGINGMTEFFIDAYRLFDQILEQSSIPRIAIDVEQGDWKAAEDLLLVALGVSRRTPSAALPVDFSRYTGTYRPPGNFPEPYNTPFAVESVGNELRLHMVFHHNYHLVPESLTHFRVRTKPWTVEFLLNEEGNATAVIYPFLTRSRHLCARISEIPIRYGLEPGGTR